MGVSFIIKWNNLELVVVDLLVVDLVEVVNEVNMAKPLQIFESGFVLRLKFDGCQHIRGASRLDGHIFQRGEGGSDGGDG